MISKKLNYYGIPILLLMGIPLLSFGQYFKLNQTLLSTEEISRNVAIADLDQDQDQDIILMMESGANVIVLNKGDEAYSRPSQFNNTITIDDTKDIAITDIDGDEDLDLIVASAYSSQHYIYKSDGSGNYEANVLLVEYPGSNVVKTFDINQDGANDLIIGRNGQNILLINKGDGNFRDETKYRLPELEDDTNELTLFDFDGDGDQDILVCNSHRNYLLVNNGIGAFIDETLQRLPLLSSINTQNAIAEDVDQDGDLDLYLATADLNGSQDGRNRLFLNVEGRYFFDVSRTNLPDEESQSYDATFIDVDNDGDLDLATAHHGHQPVSIFLNDGKGSFEEASFSYLGNQDFGQACKILAEDFDMDGLVDLYVCFKGEKDKLLLRDPEGTATTVTSSSDLTASLNYAKSINVFPNPVISNFQVEFPAPISEEIQFDLYDVTGKHIKGLSPRQQSTTTFTFQIDLDTPSGNIMLLRMTSGQKVYTKKIFKK